jgi:hypothetical protein
MTDVSVVFNRINVQSDGLLHFHDEINRFRVHPELAHDLHKKSHEKTTKMTKVMMIE